MSNPISPAELTAMRQSALQQRATTQLGREVKQAATGATTPGDAVTLSTPRPEDAAKTGASVAAHTGAVKNDPSGKTGDGTSTTANPEAAASTALGYTPVAEGPKPTDGPSLDFSAGDAGAGLSKGGSLPLGADPSSANPPSNGGSPLDPGGSPPPASSERKDMATAMQQQQAEEDQVRAIFMQMWADRRKAQAEMWKMIQDTNNKIFEIIQGVAVNRAMSIKKGMDAWAQYILM